jgi:omega-hydroxy-beta-dihydromenaquinone-9 sulfotransferase
MTYPFSSGSTSLPSRLSVSRRRNGVLGMMWRNPLLRDLGPGLLAGITVGDWLRLLSDNGFGISPSRLLRALAISAQSVRNSYENWRYQTRLKNVEVHSPIFVLGHWRSGTTHLHRLLTVDPRFAYPNSYQALYPHTFLPTEEVNSRLIERLLPKRRPMDDMEWNVRLPQEDEFALCVSTFKSPCMGWVFPHRREHYDRYLTFRGVPKREVRQWQQALMGFLQKLTVKYRRPIVLKSPPHTCRIKLLLQMFPQAKFVHVHRDPYVVFQSSRRTFQLNFELAGLQQPRLHDLDEWILRQYRAMYDVFFEERNLIPNGHFHEVRFTDLEKDPVGQMRRLYAALDLPDFEHCELAVQRYVDSIADHEKNHFPALSTGLRSRIAQDWRPCFERWGYAV